jgi:hypothetical protein
VSVELLAENDAWILASADLRVRFEALGRHWIHRIEVRIDERWQPVATSFEADPDAPAPAAIPSPTHQEVNPHTSGPLPQVLALGRFGRHHYATTFTLEDDLPTPLGDGREIQLRVDIADRGGDDADRLAATYTVHLPPSQLLWAAEGGSGVCWDPGAVPAVLCLERIPEDRETRVVADEAGRAACRAQVVAPPLPAGGTRRLRYVWILQEAPAASCPIEPKSPRA